MQILPNDSEDKGLRLLAVLMFSVFVFLLIRNYGLYPTSVDEFWNFRYARLLPLSDAVFPNYLFMYIYGVSNICRDGWMDCARLLNAALFVSASPFMYMMARRYCSSNISLWLVLLVMMGPVNSYTAYFMPESMYFFFFWFLSWYITRDGTLTSTLNLVASGVVLGVMALVKPHALFLLPAILLFGVYVHSVQKESIWSWLLKGFLILAASAIVAKLVLGYALAGSQGLTLFGRVYTRIAGSSVDIWQRYIDMGEIFVGIIKGHLLVLALIAALPIAVIAGSLIRGTSNNGSPVRHLEFYSYVLAVILVLIVVVALFTASVANTSPSETVTRLHMRYYSFSLPLLAMAAASQLSSGSHDITRTTRFWIALPLIAAIGYALATAFAPYTPTNVDGPEIYGVVSNKIVFYVLGLSGIASLLAWVADYRKGVQTFLFGFLPLLVVCSGVFVTDHLRIRMNPIVYDKAVLFAKYYLPARDLPKLVIVGPDLGPLTRSQIYIDDPRISVKHLPQESVISSSDLPRGKEWVLYIRNYSLSEKPVFEIAGDGFVLARLATSDVVDFRQAVWPGVVAKVTGLSNVEHWGTWSTGASVTLDFVRSLPKRFVLRMKARAFGPNVGKSFVLRVGGEAKYFYLRTSTEDVTLEFENPEQLNSLSIEVPLPTSPKDIGLNGDTRKLGIGLNEMRIEPIGASGS
ncbi:MAG: DUF7024 domain-containing protein [Pseudomonadota bacterium]